MQQPRPWWYRLALHLVPGRCREIPEADNPTWCEHKAPANVAPFACSICGAPARIVMRQLALWERRWYLQGFACSEDPRFMHSHPAKRMIVIGLWGRYTEHRIAGAPIERRAPYCYTMDGSHVHHVQNPSAGHTSIFLMFGVQHDDPVGGKRYYGAPIENDYATEPIGASTPGCPVTFWSKWQHHIRRKVERI